MSEHFRFSCNTPSTPFGTTIISDASTRPWGIPSPSRCECSEALPKIYNRLLDMNAVLMKIKDDLASQDKRLSKIEWSPPLSIVRNGGIEFQKTLAEEKKNHEDWKNDE